jgi:hypothetical protein
VAETDGGRDVFVAARDMLTSRREGRAVFDIRRGPEEWLALLSGSQLWTVRAGAPDA